MAVLVEVTVAAEVAAEVAGWGQGRRAVAVRRGKPTSHMRRSGSGSRYEPSAISATTSDSLGQSVEPCTMSKGSSQLIGGAMRTAECRRRGRPPRRKLAGRARVVLEERHQHERAQHRAQQHEHRRRRDLRLGH